MKKRGLLVICFALTTAACHSKPTAAGVCGKLVAAGVAANCKSGTPGGLGAAASEQAVFDLPSVPGETGQVLRFDKSSDFEATTKAYDAVAVLAGRHRYGSSAALIFVQLNSGASTDIGAKAEAVVNAL